MKTVTAQIKVYTMNATATKTILLYVGAPTNAATKDEKRWIK